MISGKVQGVWFRESTRRVAEKLGLQGVARNLPDGRVEVIAEGDGASLSELSAWLQSGPPMARVDSVTESESEFTGLSGFTTR
jgi:acylphosphatase